MTPTDHAAMMRFTYPGDDASVIFDNVTNDGGLTLDAENGSFTGFSDVKSGLSTGATRLFVYGVFDAPVTAAASCRRARVTGYLRFDAGRGPHGHAAARDLADQRRPGEEEPRAEIPAGIGFDAVKDARAGRLGRASSAGWRSRAPTATS